MKIFKLDGKVAIVTGGAGLYGKPISLALAEAGALVIVASRDLEKCEAYAMVLKQQGFKAEGMFLDMGDEQSIQNFTRKIIERHGQIDILVNNAVSREGFKDLEQVTKTEWERSQQINSTGLMLITQAVVLEMKVRGSGNIINIGSIQGVVGPNFGIYGDTGMTSPLNYTYDKWGMVGFTKWLANFYGKFNIRANCISPGGYGPGVAELIGKNEFVDNYKKMTPLGRFAEDDDIKGPVIFLASEASAYITGHNLLVDGGWTSW
ncbi:SDR family oxidoreductase [Pedobacter heparinus]|uniref:SDR family oxidoreductase n=1 Tax=Pedobacter heparinus TaxID=984 RepID=UPI00292DB221|nr:SDR family oxidoreductase [Pedobacter heparinus]